MSLTLANAFVQEKTAKTSSDTFTIPVKQVANLSLDAPNYSVDTMAGDSFNLSMNLYNKGQVDTLQCLGSSGKRQPEGG